MSDDIYPIKNRLDLLQFLKDNDVEITISTECRDCGYSYNQLNHDEYHDCKLPDGKAKMVFSEHIKIQAEKDADELIGKLLDKK